MSGAAVWGNALGDAQREARDERERKTRVAAQKLSFGEYFFEREQEQARKALANMDTLKRDVRRVRKKIRVSNRCLLDPKGRILQWNDALTMIALLYTVFITPYEIGFLTQSTQPLVLDFCNYAVTLVFGVNILLQFITPYQLSYLQGGGKVKSHRKIAVNYLRGWFVLDLMSTIPYDAVAKVLIGDIPLQPLEVLPPLKGTVAAATLATAGDDGNLAMVAGNLRLVRTLRFLRLLKLGRVGAWPTGALLELTHALNLANTQNAPARCLLR